MLSECWCLECTWPKKQSTVCTAPVYSGGSRKLGTGGGARNGGGGGRLRQNQVLAVCTERSTGKSPPPPLPYHYGSERGGRNGSAPLNPRLVYNWFLKHDIVIVTESHSPKPKDVPGFNVVTSNMTAPNRGGVAIYAKYKLSSDLIYDLRSDDQVWFSLRSVPNVQFAGIYIHPNDYVLWPKCLC